MAISDTAYHLTEAWRHWDGSINEAQEKERTCQKLQSEIEKLTKEKMELDKKCAALAVKTDELDKKTSSSRDARKMFGDITAGDTTHQDVILSYQSHFQTAHRNLPKICGAKTKEEKFEAWEKASDIVEKSFEQNKEVIISEMMSELGTALLNPPPRDKPIDDKTSDLYRAFEVYAKKMETSELERVKEEVVKEMVEKNHSEKNYAEECADVAANIVVQIDPEDYYSFIKEGKKRPKNYSERSTAIIRTKVDGVKKCAACKKTFDKDKGDTPTYHLGLYWHQRHCYCANCHKIVSDDKFKYFKKYNSTYCNKCLCCKCQLPLDDKVLQTGHGLYHHACLACAYCHHVKDSVMAYGDKFVCQACVKKYFKK